MTPEAQLEQYLRTHGESVCLASLPLVIEEIAAEAAPHDAQRRAQIESALRRRAGLHPG